MYVTPIEAKKDERIRSSGRLTGFTFKGKNFPITPKTLFYDWVYCRTLLKNPNLVKDVVEFDIFTDIEFNHEKSINCQARSATIFVYLYKNNLIDTALSNIDVFKDIIYKKNDETFEQMTLF